MAPSSDHRRPHASFALESRWAGNVTSEGPCRPALSEVAWTPGRSGSRRIVDTSDEGWSRSGESNPGPIAYEAIALPLSYSGLGAFDCNNAGLRQTEQHGFDRERRVCVLHYGELRG